MLPTVTCDYIVSDNHYFLRAINGLMELAAALGRNDTCSTMEAVYAKTQAAFARTFAGSGGNSALALSRGHPARPAPLPVLASKNQTQSLISLVLTAGPGLAQKTKEDFMVAMLNDLLSTDVNCVLSGGGNPAGDNYGCFRQRAHFTGGMVVRRTNTAGDPGFILPRVPAMIVRTGVQGHCGIP